MDKWLPFVTEIVLYRLGVAFEELYHSPLESRTLWMNSTDASVLRTTKTQLTLRSKPPSDYWGSCSDSSFKTGPLDECLQWTVAPQSLPARGIRFPIGRSSTCNNLRRCEFFGMRYTICMSYYSPIAGWRCWSSSCWRHEPPQGESDRMDQATFHRQYWAHGAAWSWYKRQARVWSRTYWTFTLSGWLQLGRLFVSNFRSFRKLVWRAEFLIAYARRFVIIIQILLSQRTPGPHSCTKVEYTIRTIPTTVCLRARFWLWFAGHLSLWYIDLRTQRPSSPSSHLLVQYPRRLKVDVRRIRGLPIVARELT